MSVSTKKIRTATQFKKRCQRILSDKPSLQDVLAGTWSQMLIKCCTKTQRHLRHLHAQLAQPPTVLLSAAHLLYSWRPRRSAET